MKNFKTIVIMVMAVVMCLSLAACGSKGIGKDIKETQNVNVETATTAPAPFDTAHFSGKIASIDGDEAIVTPNKGEDILNSGNAIRINIAKYSKPLKAGDAVTIYYDGVIMESYPLQINLLGINDEMFDIEEPSNSPDLNEAVTTDNPKVTK